MTGTDVFVYGNAQTFLRAWFRTQKKKGKQGLTLTDFARLAGCSPGHVRNILTGCRSLRLPLVQGFCRAMNLDCEASDQFRLLVSLAVAPSSERTAIQRQIQVNQRQRRASQSVTPPRRSVMRPGATGRVRVDSVAVWAPVLKALARCDGYRPEPAWVAQRTRPAISPRTASAVLRALSPQEDAPRTRSARAIGDTNHPLFQDSTLVRARDALHTVPTADRRFRTSIWSLPPGALDRLKRETEAFLAEIQGIYDEATRAAAASGEALNVVYQVNVQIFPLSDPLDQPG